jgi:hypothetical protein
MAETPLDRAHAGIEEAPGDDAARLRFYDHLAGAELLLLLASEAEGQDITPEVFPVDGVSFVLAFDTEERLSAFAGGIAPYAALSGRALAPMLAGAGLGLALNPDVAPSATLLPPEAIAWFAATLAERPAEVEARPVSVAPPSGLPDRLLSALDAKLASAGGLARHAWLAEVTYAGGRAGHLLAFVDAPPGAEPGLARAVGEALTFSGVEAGELDVGFFRSGDPVMSRLAKVGLRFDLPEPDRHEAPAAPGMDPDRPPRLR